MKKLVLGAAVSAAMFGGVAQAAITLDAGKPVITPANTYEVYLSGSSAVGPFIESLFTSKKVPAANQVCDTKKSMYKFQDTSTGGKDQVAYLCELNQSNTALSGLSAGKTNLLIYKRHNGGSAQGVSPIVANSAIDFLKVDNAANCALSGSVVAAGAGFTKFNCTYTAGNTELSNKQIPDFGVSDVDPIQFRGDNTPTGYAEVTAADVSNLVVKAAATQVFGVAVSTNLRNAMQEAVFGKTNVCATNAKTRETAACMPSLNSAQIASIFTGQLSSWKQLKLGGTTDVFTGASVQPGSDRLHICRRASGSGTQAQLAIKFMGYPCNDIAPKGIADTAATPELVDKAQVHAMTSAGAMSECLAELSSGSDTVGTSFVNTYGARWAIGMQGTELNASLSSDWRFIKIDGEEPTLDKVARGKYKDWVELTYQYNKAHVFDESEQQIVDEIIKQSGNPVVLAATNALSAVHTWGAAGYLATPQSFKANEAGLYGSGSPVNPFSHGTTTASTNNCRLPALYDPKGGIQLK
ncbi:MAG: hypothetical protein ACOYM1_02450 [Methylovulum sp.]